MRKVMDHKVNPMKDFPHEHVSKMPAKKPERTLRVSIDADILEALELLADAKSTTANSLVVQLIRQALAEEPA